MCHAGTFFAYVVLAICLIVLRQTLRCVLYGPGAVKNQGAKSSKARNVNAELWGCTKVTIPMLAFAATAVCYCSFRLTLLHFSTWIFSIGLLYSLW